MRFTLLTVLFLGTGVQAATSGDAPLDDYIAATYAHESDEGRSVVPLDYPGLRAHLGERLAVDTALMLGLVRKGTPYLWGGDDWVRGIDCSHFTRKVYELAGTGYTQMMTTKELSTLTDANGLKQIPLSEARRGDLLVYGEIDAAGAWHGHVVILVDRAFGYGGHTGLVLGSHGGVGVQFLTVRGFPEYWREPAIQLRNVLRVVAHD